MKKYGYFHDSVIKEMKYISGAFVNSDLYMNPVNSELRLNIIFQRQYKNPTVIEMEFSGLNKLSLVPNNKDYTCEILEASFFIDNDTIYWVDCSDFYGSLEEYMGTWIAAKKVKWRVIDDYVGENPIFDYKY